MTEILPFCAECQGDGFVSRPCCTAYDVGAEGCHCAEPGYRQTKCEACDGTGDQVRWACEHCGKVFDFREFDEPPHPESLEILQQRLCHPCAMEHMVSEFCVLAQQVIRFHERTWKGQDLIRLATHCLALAGEKPA